MRRIVLPAHGGRRRGYLVLPTLVPWWPYYTRVYGQAMLPGWTLASQHPAE